MNKQLLNYLLMMGSQASHKILRFLIIVLVVRNIGIANWGEVVILMAVITYGVLLADFGQGSIAPAYSLEDNDKEKKLISWHFWKHILIGISSVGVISIYEILQDTSLFNLKIYCIIFLFKALTPEWLYLRHYKGGIFGLLQTAKGLIQLLILLIIGKKLNVTIFILTELVAEFTFTLIHLIYWKKQGKLGGYNWNTSFWWVFTKETYFAFLMSLAIFLHTNADLFILNMLMDSSSVGIYSTYYRVMIFYYMVGGTLAIVFKTKAAYLIKENRTVELVERMKQNWKILFAMSTGFLILSGSLLNDIVQYVFKISSNQDSKLPLILSIYLILSFFSIIFGELLIAKHRLKLLFQITIVGAIVNVSLNFALIPIWGLHGAALATVVAEMFILLFMIKTIEEIKLNSNFVILNWKPFMTLTMILLVVGSDLSNTNKLFAGVGVWMFLFLSKWIKFQDVLGLLKS